MRETVWVCADPETTLNVSIRDLDFLEQLQGARGGGGR